VNLKIVLIGLTVLIVVLGSILAYTLYLIHTLNLKIYQLELQVQDLKASYELQKLNCEVRYRELLDKLNHTYEKLSKLEGELLDFRNQLNLVMSIASTSHVILDMIMGGCVRLLYPLSNDCYMITNIPVVGNYCVDLLGVVLLIISILLWVFRREV